MAKQRALAGSCVVFQGIRTSIAKKTCIFVIFHGGFAHATNSIDLSSVPWILSVS